ncbi:TIR domain-containing protein [Nostoc sp. LEGE 12447]|nr:TIR domain-containing protein [Nostoc sp. LEGE 12447]
MDSKILYRISENLKKMNQIYISYAWKDNKSELGSQREELVDKICTALISERYNLIRDRNYLTLGKSIHDFMQEIGRGNYVIVVVSDKYLRSEYCMFEAVEIMKRKDYEQKVFPVVLQDANVYTKEGKTEYIKYWKQQSETLKQLMGSELSAHEDSAMYNVAEKIMEISQKIDEFMFFISDKLSIDPSQNFNGFINQLTDAIKNDAVKLRSKKSILVAGTGFFDGDAKKVFDEMLANWDSKLMGNISPEKFKSLNQYINDPSTAEDVVNDVMDIVNEIIFAKTMLNTQGKLI